MQVHEELSRSEWNVSLFQVDNHTSAQKTKKCYGNRLNKLFKAIIKFHEKCSDKTEQYRSGFANKAILKLTFVVL